MADQASSVVPPTTVVVITPPMITVTGWPTEGLDLVAHGERRVLEAGLLFERRRAGGVGLALAAAQEHDLDVAAHHLDERTHADAVAGAIGGDTQALPAILALDEIAHRRAANGRVANRHGHARAGDEGVHDLADAVAVGRIGPDVVVLVEPAAERIERRRARERREHAGHVRLVEADRQQAELEAGAAHVADRGLRLRRAPRDSTARPAAR